MSSPSFPGFRILDASNVRPFPSGIGGHEVSCLPLINNENNTIVNPTSLKDYKFALTTKLAPKTELENNAMLVYYLTQAYHVPEEIFYGGAKQVKCGMVFFPHNEYDTAVRLWRSKQVGKNVIYEITVATYKDAVPKPIDKPKMRVVAMTD